MKIIVKKIKWFIKQIRSEKGVTLIELMVVMAIIAILGFAIVPKMVNIVRDARVSKTKSTIKDVENILMQYNLDNSMYPTTEQGLQALISEPTTEPLPSNYSEGGYIQKNLMPKDAWGSEFIYISPGEDGRDYDIISLGADKAEGGDKYNADIKSWEIE